MAWIFPTACCLLTIYGMILVDSRNVEPPWTSKENEIDGNHMTGHKSPASELEGKFYIVPHKETIKVIF